QMLVLALGRGTKVDAILPLMKGRSVLSRKLGGPPVNTIESMTNFHSHEFDVISPDLRPSHVRLALDHLLKYHDFHLLRLGPLCEESPAWKLFQLEASRRNLSFTLSESHRTPYIPVGYDWGSFFQGLPRSLRRQIKKAQRLLDQGSSSFQLARESRLITPNAR
ncbi:MAG: hypothetical protein JSU96_13580, partial [Acidobacteriota bacterium]